MGPDSDRHAVAEACLKAAEQVNRHGSPTLQQAMRVVLFILGRELAQRAGGHAHPGEAFSRITSKRSA